MQKSFIITAVLYAVVGSAVAEEKGISPQLQRPPDIATERLDRPQLPQAQSPGAVTHTTLTQAEVVRLAKSAAKKEKGRKLDDYDLRSVIFDTENREWTVSFDPKPPRRASAECLLISVNGGIGARHEY